MPQVRSSLTSQHHHSPYKVASLLQYLPVTFLPGQRLLSSVPVASLHEVAPLLCAFSRHFVTAQSCAPYGLRPRRAQCAKSAGLLAFGLVVHSVYEVRRPSAVILSLHNHVLNAAFGLVVRRV